MSAIFVQKKFEYTLEMAYPTTSQTNINSLITSDSFKKEVQDGLKKLLNARYISYRHRRQHVYCAGIDARVLEMTAPASTFQRYVEHVQRRSIYIPIHMSLHMSFQTRRLQSCAPGWSRQFPRL